MHWKRPPHQKVVVCKIPPPQVSVAEALPRSRLASELSCCLQDVPRRGRKTKPLLRNALGRKLSWCLQDRATAGAGPGGAAGSGWPLPQPGSFPDSAASNRDARTATCERSPNNPADTRHRRRSFGGGNQRAVAAGNRAGYTPLAWADTSLAGRFGRNSGSAVRSYRRCRTPAIAPATQDLETAIECVPRPRPWPSPTSKPAEMLSFYSGADIPDRLARLFRLLPDSERAVGTGLVGSSAATLPLLDSMEDGA
jgi:hypothetical protein